MWVSKHALHVLLIKCIQHWKKRMSGHVQRWKMKCSIHGENLSQSHTFLHRMAQLRVKINIYNSRMQSKAHKKKINVWPSESMPLCVKILFFWQNIQIFRKIEWYLCRSLSLFHLCLFVDMKILNNFSLFAINHCWLLWGYGWSH